MNIPDKACLRTKEMGPTGEISLCSASHQSLFLVATKKLWVVAVGKSVFIVGVLFMHSRLQPFLILCLPSSYTVFL